jgi:hypothetical protein
MKKESTPKRMGFKASTSEEKISNPKTQGAQNKDHQ